MGHHAPHLSPLDPTTMPLRSFTYENEGSHTRWFHVKKMVHLCSVSRP